jgi:hypothetical protein
MLKDFLMAFMLLRISRYALLASSSKEVGEDIAKSFPLLPLEQVQFEPHLLRYWRADYSWLGQNDRTPSFNEGRA